MHATTAAPVYDRKPKMFQLALVIFLGLSVSPPVYATLPGARVRLTNAGFDYGVEVAIRELSKSISSATLSPIHGSGSGLSYYLTSLKISHFSISQKSMRPVPGSGIKWHLGGVDMQLIGNFAFTYKQLFIKISDHGNFYASVSGVSLDLAIKITGIDEEGRPILAPDGCNCQINDIRVKFHGSRASWLYNLLVGYTKGKIKEIIQKAVCGQANKAVSTDGNHALKKLKFSTKFADHFLLNYGLVQTPRFTNDYVEVDNKGAVYWATDIVEPPYTPPQLAAFTGTSKMIYVWLTEYIANTFSYAAFTHNYLHYNVTADELPADSRRFLNTTCKGSMACIGVIIRQIGEKYPNCTVKIALNATQAPIASIRPKALGVIGVGEARFYAITPQNVSHYMMHLSLDLLMRATGKVKDDRLYANVKTLTLKFHVIESKIGDIQDIILDTIGGLAMKLFVKPKLNEMGAKGFDLPVTGAVRFKDPKLILQKGAIIIQSDVAYKEDDEEPKSPWMGEETGKSFEVVDGSHGNHPNVLK